MNPFASISTPPIASIQVTSGTTVTTGSGTDALLTGMTATPIAGTYFVMFSGVLQNNTAGDTITVSFYINGVQDATSVRSMAPFDGGALAAGQGSCVGAVQGVYSVNGSQAIAVHWHTSGGTATSFTRSMTLLKIG